MFPLSYENNISECSLNVQNVQFFTCFKNIFVGYTTIGEKMKILLSLCRRYGSLNILKQAVCFKGLSLSHWSHMIFFFPSEDELLTFHERCTFSEL